MPGEIQTSFIPKAPITTTAYRPAQQSSVGFMTVISLILVLSSAAACGGAFAYQAVLTKQNEVVKASIASLRADMPIENLKKIERLDSALTNANTLLDNHVSSNRIFKLLQDSVIPAVRYTNFSFSGSEVKVKGTARTYEDVAAQANVFNAMAAKITSFEFSDFTVDKLTKVVSFSLALTVAPDAFRYDPSELVVSTTSPIRPAATGTASTTN